MADFGPDMVFYTHFQTAISQEPLGVRSWNFQSSHISMIPTNGAKVKKFWEVRVSSSKKNWMIWYGIAQKLNVTLIVIGWAWANGCGL